MLNYTYRLHGCFAIKIKIFEVGIGVVFKFLWNGKDEKSENNFLLFFTFTNTISSCVWNSHGQKSLEVEYDIKWFFFPKNWKKIMAKRALSTLNFTKTLLLKIFP